MIRRAPARAAAQAAALAAALAAGPAPAGADGRRSGYLDMGPATQAMQDDDLANPAMFWVMEGAGLWAAPAGPDGRSCAGCHGPPEAMAGVAARYPAFDPASGAAVDLTARIGLCRTRHQGAEPFAPESRPLLALAALVALQSRGRPIAPDPDPRLDPVRALGAALWHQRMGQLNLSCALCHDDHAGGSLGGARIPQAHPTAYPIYRLEWQEVGSLQRRLRGCLTGVRAEPFDWGAPELVALEAYLAARAAGMAVESPGVRP